MGVSYQSVRAPKLQVICNMQPCDKIAIGIDNG